MSRLRNNETTKSTAQQLGALIKSARDIMRKDKGLNGDLDRLPMLTWIMFLKFLDDMERLQEEEASIRRETYNPIIEKPYRWRDWAAPEDGLTGEELSAFIGNDEAVRPDGTRGPGLIAYLRALQSTNGYDRRDAVAGIFSGLYNRMASGYLLKDVVSKVDGIHFTSSEELHTLSRLYESMLKEMRDAAGDSGEFYTPRSVVQFMVNVIDPKIGEEILDPACGTAGFLVETFEHLSRQVQTTAERRTLQESAIQGEEAKQLPYMLAEMNLLLHGLEYPDLKFGNALNQKITELGDRDRVDIVLTNPPFGGEEEAGIKSNFPADKQTTETALLFAQLIVRRLKRPERNNGKPGRAGVVVPDGFLSNTGVASRVKEELLERCGLRYVVKLPFGVFEPYTPIRTNILFFDRAGPTSGVWFYEVPMPDERKKFTKTKPLRLEHLAECRRWMDNPETNENAWFVSIEDIKARDYSLDFRNPAATDLTENKDPTELLSTVSRDLEEMRESVREIVEILRSE